MNILTPYERAEVWSLMDMAAGRLKQASQKQDLAAVNMALREIDTLVLKLERSAAAETMAKGAAVNGK